jgi:hypothetical protein
MTCQDKLGRTISAGSIVKRFGDNGRSTVSQVVEKDGKRMIRLSAESVWCYNPKNFIVVSEG